MNTRKGQLVHVDKRVYIWYQFGQLTCGLTDIMYIWII